MSIKKFLARNKLRVFIGTGFAGIITSTVTYLTFGKVWQDTFIFYGIPMLLVYACLIIGYPVFCLTTAYIYEFSGLWAEEVSHQNTTLNPEFEKLCKDVEEIKQLLKK